MVKPVHYPSGISNAAKRSTLAVMGMPDPTRYHVWFDDFDKYTAADWTLTTTEAGAGSATEAASSADGGVLVVTNDAADNDADFFQWPVETFKFVAGKELWFKARVKISDVTQSDFVMGLQITDTTPLAVSDGVYFRKDDGDSILDCVTIKDSSATTESLSGLLADNTWVTMGFHYDGKNGIEWFVDDVKRATTALTNLPDDEELTISFGIQNGEAVAKVLSVDYIAAIKER